MAICLKVAKEQKHWSRHNGWSLPLHPLQVSAWFFLVMFAFLYFGVLVPNMPVGAWQISAYFINGSVFICHIIIHLISVSLNPADINVRAKASKGPLSSFDRSKHSHVIENEYCHICEVKVGRRSKHCSACNKCVSEFDHHCKWLNNCVGGRNYRLFMSCVTSALLGSLIIFISSVVMIVAYFEGSPWLFRTKYLDITVPSTPFSTDNNVTEFPILYSTTESLIFQNITFSNWGTQTILCAQVHGTVWICIVFITAALSLLAIALLGHLLGFHIFLMCQNFASTYDYIVHKRDQPANKRPETKRKHSDLDCHFHILQHLKTKKGNQISPKTQENGKGDDIEEWELQANISHSNTRPEPKKPTMPLVTENKCAASTEEEDCPLEHYVGHVYIGSPHRRRHYLEPINIHQKSSSPKNKPGKKEESPLKKRTSDKEENDEKDNDSLTDNDSQSSGSSSSLSQVFGHGGVPRRLHRTPSPAPLLSPILESEMTSGSAIVSWKHRSVSEQSLHTLDEDEEDVTAVPTTCTVEIEPSLSKGSHENSGSLSNLFLSKDELEEDIEEEDNNNVIIDDDNRVHEVCIIPQKDDLESNCNNGVEVIENADPVVNGEVWAYTSRNGCQIKDNIVSFKRSCSMQDNERIKNLSSGGVSDPLTRCCSEDELKSVQRMTKLQRRLSEDRDLWMLRGGCSNIPQTWREHSPKAGVSATAVFCVDEPEESFRIPGIPFGIKRKYNHFSVPNHIVLPCSNSVHPESRKRTRPVGSKPPKAFHA